MVSKRVSSSGWTGPTDQTLLRGAFTHRAGEFGGTTDYALLSRKQPISFAVPEELRGVVKLAAWLLLSPVVLAAGWFAGNLGVRDAVISDASGFLLLWGLPVFAFAFWQLVSRSFQLIFVRSFILALLMVATASIAFGYAVTARRSYAEAVVSQPQRVFRYVAGSRKNMLGRRSAVFRHQQVDGTDLEGASKRPLMQYGHCLTVQARTGNNGFRWLRVIEQAPPPKSGGLAWPVRRADCFSDKPLAEMAG